MRENRFDSLSQMLSERIAGITSGVTAGSKNEQPFDQPKVEPIDKVYVYDKLSDDQRVMLIQKHGIDAYDAWRRDVDKIKQSRGII